MSFLQKGAGFLLLPLYTVYLSPEQFGIANVVNASAAIFIMLLSLALDDAVARYYFIYKTNPEKQVAFLGSVVTFTLVISACALTILLIFKEPIFSLLVNDKVPGSLIIFGIISIVTAPLYAIQQKIHIIEESPFHYTLNTFTFFLLNTVLCILFIVKYEMGAAGLLLSAAIVQALFFIYSLIFLSKRMSFVIKWDYLSEALKYSMPLLLNRISSWGLVNFNNIYLGKLLSNAAVGLFNIANYFSLIITVLAQSVAMAYQPFVYKMLDKGSHGKENLGKTITLLSLIFCVAGFVLAIVANDLLAIFIDEKYSSAATIIPTIIWGETISAISTSYIYILFYYSNAPKYISYSTILAAVINITGCVFFIPRLGITGAIFSLFTSNIISAAYKFYYAKKISGIKLNTWRMILIPTSMFCGTLVIQHFSINFITRIIILIIIVTSVLFYNKKEIKWILNTINK